MIDYFCRMQNYSFVIPVYNRPGEIRELLESMVLLDFDRDFEVVIVEDGSEITAEAVVSEFSEKLQISYYQKPNSGPGNSRNYGMLKAKGNYFIILDSDVLLPPQYLQAVDSFLKTGFFHCFGGADAAHPDFSPLQKAIDYVMTSPLTTGGIRGSSHQKFEPRSFNMGISKEAFEKTGGFGRIHPGEDPDLSQRIRKAGYKTTFIPDAYVFHKRRISWEKFYTQVRKFGLVRPVLTKWHPGSGRLAYWFPLFFIGFVLISIGLAWISVYFLLPLLLYLLAIGIDSGFKNKSMAIGFMSLLAVFIQFGGYGLGFFQSYCTVHILRKSPEKAFPFLFFD